MKIENLSLNMYDSKSNFQYKPQNKEQAEINQIDKFTIPKTNFSYDTETDTLVVKVKAGNVLHQFPSDDLLRMKKFLMENS